MGLTGQEVLLAWRFHSCSHRGPSRPEEVGLRKYETMLILPADADDTLITGVTDHIGRVIGESGGQVDRVDRWGKRRLTYEIKRQQEGFYLVVESTAQPSAMRELDRVLSLADPVIRFKTVVRPDLQPTEATEPAQPARSAEAREPAQPARSAEATETAQPAEAPQSAQPAGAMEPARAEAGGSSNAQEAAEAPS